MEKRPSPQARLRACGVIVHETFAPPLGYLFLKFQAELPNVLDSDALLVRRSLRGDSLAVRALVERFQAEVFGVCLRMLQHRQDAEDVSQEVFLRVFRSLRRWDSSRPLKPWIMGITVNRCRTWLAQRVRRPQPVDYLHDTVASPPTDDVGELTSEIHSALGQMRVEYRSVFVLFHEQGLPYEDIGRALDKPVGTIKTWLHRARLELLAHLQKRGMISEVNHELP